ncbi:MAG: hypothetical protein OXG81_13405 [Acidobacteria bacterium]|nr:hypothetical protein [Acidobacteriota bacterium]
MDAAALLVGDHDLDVHDPHVDHIGESDYRIVALCGRGAGKKRPAPPTAATAWPRLVILTGSRAGRPGFRIISSA